MDELFTRDLQQIIKDNPLSLLDFEAIILKLTAAFESQLVRVQQVGAQTDLISVSQYYSSKLVNYIRQVLQIIPATILQLISCIIEIQTSQLRRNQHQQRSLSSFASTGSTAAMPSKIALDNLRDYAQPEERARMLQLTCKISHYARGMIAMPSTAIGLVRINAKRMLEDGLRRELNEKMRRVVEETLHFDGETGGPRAGKQGDSRQLIDKSQRLMAKLEELAITLSGYKRAFEYIQDFLAIYGLRMWQEELANIVRAHVDQAISETKDQQVVDQRSHGPAKSVMSFSTLVRSTAVVVAPSGSKNHEGIQLPRSFMTSLLEELLKITCARETIYDEQTSAWYNRKQEQVLDGTRVCKLIAASLGVAGLNGLDRLCSTRLMAELEQLARSEDASSQWQVFETLDQMSSNKLLRNDELAPSSVDSRRQQMLSLFFALIGGGIGGSQNQKQQQHHQLSERLIDRLLLVGQLQTLRLCIACVLSANCRHEARHLYGCLSAVNDILLATLKHGGGVGQSRSAELTVVPNQQKRAAAAVGSSSSSLVAAAAAEECLSEANERARTTMSSGPQLDESQLVFELANHLEWIGLSDPRSKIYTMALHQRGRLEQQQQQVADGEQHFATSGSTALTSKTGNAAIIHRILEESLKINQQQQRPMQPKGSAASWGLNAGGGGAHASQATLDGQPLYLGLQTLLNHIGRAQVVVAPAMS
jgi:WASH complex subunit strumpellin